MNSRPSVAAVAALASLLMFSACTATPVAVSTPSIPTTTPSPTVSAPSPSSSPTAAPPVREIITGRFGYGSDFIPPVTVYAIRTTDQRIWYSVAFPGLGNPPRHTPQPGTSGDTYTITGVAPGTYWVVAYRDDGLLPGPGYYSRQVECMRAKPSGPCADISLVPATVTAGQTTSGIDVLISGPPPPGQPSPTFPPRPTPR